ncbi:MAG: right-handed parallel beta-helix repeat-containing protein, partial [Anaerolineales bacterium]|nr:right-handed parallel beta-helix repeat-containing protein [Anaerolineales bacterium]
EASTTCNSCADCNTKLASGLYDTVILSNDILNQGGSCIGLVYGESNLTFDCNGHTIDGDDIAIDPENGIGMFHGSNNTIQNCTVSDFSYGIYLWDVTNHTLSNNVLLSNGAGLALNYADTSTVNNNTSSDNYTGILIDNDSDLNSINTNVVCNNSSTDFSLVSGSGSNGNAGDNNTCNLPDGWNDSGTTGCTYLCSGSTTCSSCADCTSKLDGTFDTVLLTADINNYSGTCITFGASNVLFNGNGHVIDGDDSGTDYGVYMSGRTGNTVRNCTVQDFYNGIRVYNSTYTMIDHNTATSNTNTGIYLTSANNNDVMYNTSSNNGWDGITLSTSSGNEVYGNTAVNNDYGYYLSSANSNTVNFNSASNNNRGISLFDASSNQVHSNDLSCNDLGITFSAANNNTLNLNDVCSNPGLDFTLTGSTGNSGDLNTCDAAGTWNDSGTTGCTYLCNDQRCSTCTDGVQNGNETGVDCGGSYCPACAQCTTGARYAPNDTPCQQAWPTSNGPDIGMNTETDSCNLVEVCDPNLDYLITDALNCCEYADYSSHLANPHRTDKISACAYAQSQAYPYSFSSDFDPDSLQMCLAHYLIRGFGSNAIYMQNYFDGEWSCYGDRTASSCNEWEVDPPAWEMGTAVSCAGPGGSTPDFLMGGHRCEYIDAWIFGTYGKEGYWNSDSNYHSNSDSVVDTPTHASINRLSTGTCVDYSFALTTALRKAGFSKDDIFSVNGDGHGYNLLRLPGEPKWHYVDTVGNGGGGVYGGSYPSPQSAWYAYCTSLDDGCSNDAYSESVSRCPSNSMIYGCETALRETAVALTTLPLPAAPRITLPLNVVVSPSGPECTELNPCIGEYELVSTTPAPAIALKVTKSLAAATVNLGQAVAVTVNVENLENSAVTAVVQERFAPGIDYDLTAQIGRYEAFTFQYHTWNLQIPALGSQAIVFTITPQSVGTHSLMPTEVAAGSSDYRANVAALTVTCVSNGVCDAGENLL